jgi:hypothetical protein
VGFKRGGTINYSNNMALYHAESDTLGPYKGDPAPGTPSTFASFQAPVVEFAGGSSTNAAYLAKLALIGGVTKTTSTGLWTTLFGGPSPATSLVARTGDVAPGTPGDTFARLISVAQDVNATVLFTGALNLTVTTTKLNNYGLWARPNGGGTQLVLRTGDSMTTPAGLKTVKSFKVLHAVSGSGGQTRALNAGSPGSAVMLVTFIDHTKGIALVTLPSGIIIF